MTTAGQPTVPRRMTWAVFFVSAGVLGYQVGLMRMLLVASWHHFAFLVISLALLGFGASGTALSLLRGPVMRRPGPALDALVLATAVLMPVCAVVVQQIPVEARIVPLLLWRQAGWWLLYWLVVSLPYFTGAAAIGLALMAAPGRVGTVYASNLVGSAAGAAGVTVAMLALPPAWLPALTGGMALVGLLDLPRTRRGRLRIAAAAAVVATLVGVWLAASPPAIRPDPYKYSAYVDRLLSQDQAERLASAYSPRAAVHVYRSDLFHDLPFLGFGAAPPPMDSLTLDGHQAGSLLRVEGPEEAAAVDNTLMAAPYALLPDRPEVALLGETDGVNTWLALRQGAVRVVVVQPDETLMTLLRGPLGDGPGAVLRRDGVEVVTAEPRHFVEASRDRFDLVQLVTLQALGGGGGIAGLAEDHLVTVDGIAASLDRLRPEGVLAVTRGIETPPRDNVKLLATVAAGLEELGVAEPGRHVVVLRDYLGVCTMVRREPWSAADVARVRDLLAERQLTPVWFPGVRDDELNRPDALPGPEGEPGDWYHHAAVELLSPRAGKFVEDYVYDVRPPTDARPFFRDFTRLAALDVFRRAFGDLWLTRTELAYLFVLAAAGAVAVVGFLATVAPLLLQRAVRRTPGRAVAAAYFTCLGLGYLLLEMTLLSRVTFLVGDPVTAASVVLTAFLLLSGAGSAVAQRLDPGRRWPVPAAVAGIVVVAVLQVVLLDPITSWIGAAPLLGRCAAAVLLVAPLAFLMGFPMPLGLARLHRGAAPLVPLAWGVNGFASVLASPLAILLAMTWSYHVTAACAVAVYLGAAALYRSIPS